MDAGRMDKWMVDWMNGRMEGRLSVMISRCVT